MKLSFQILFLFFIFIITNISFASDADERRNEAWQRQVQKAKENREKEREKEYLKSPEYKKYKEDAENDKKRVIEAQKEEQRQYYLSLSNNPAFFYNKIIENRYTLISNKLYKVMHLKFRIVQIPHKKLILGTPLSLNTYISSSSILKEYQFIAINMINTEEMVDDQLIYLSVIKTGTFEYVSTISSKKTIHLFKQVIPIPYDDFLQLWNNNKYRTIDNLPEFEL